MDALFFFRHSANHDVEIRYALRSIDRHMPWVRKVWIFGDRPAFLADDTAIVEHLPHERIAWIGGFATPVRNFFLMYFLTALYPELTPEYIHFSDDFMLLSDWSIESASKVRYLEDLSQAKSRGRGVWKESLWRTHDTLKRLGYPVLNYETHTPAHFRKQWVIDAYRDFRDYVTEDRWFGLTGATAILNHAWQHHRMPLTKVAEESSRLGFYGTPPTYEEVRNGAPGKLFLNFDDKAFGPGIRQFLAERFPTPSRFEADGEPVLPPISTFVSDTHSVFPQAPADDVADFDGIVQGKCG